NGSVYIVFLFRMPRKSLSDLIILRAKSYIVIKSCLFHCPGLGDYRAALEV
ncbi:hypothetical protein BgiMline_032106, partial [Biomphalaria glabrata]